MKIGIIKFVAALAIVLGFCGCDTIPIRGKVCYTTGQGTVCVGSSGGALEIDGTFRGQK